MLVCSHHPLQHTRGHSHTPMLTPTPAPHGGPNPSEPLTKEEREGQGVSEGSRFLSHPSFGIHRSELREPAATASRARVLASRGSRTWQHPRALRLSTTYCSEHAHCRPPLPGALNPAASRHCPARAGSLSPEPLTGPSWRLQPESRCACSSLLQRVFLGILPQGKAGDWGRDWKNK